MRACACVCVCVGVGVCVCGGGGVCVCVCGWVGGCVGVSVFYRYAVYWTHDACSVRFPFKERCSDRHLQTLGVGLHRFLLQVTHKPVTEPGAEHVPDAEHSDEHTCQQAQIMNKTLRQVTRVRDISWCWLVHP